MDIKYRKFEGFKLCKLDTKGRLNFPSSYHKIIEELDEESRDDLVLTVDAQNNRLIIDVFNTAVQRYKAQSGVNDVDAQRLISSVSFPLLLDAQKRLQIQKEALSQMGVPPYKKGESRAMTIVHAKDRFEIYASEAWSQKIKGLDLG